MDNLLFIITLLIMISIPVLLTYFFFRWVKRSRYKKLLYILAVLPLAIVAYAVYDAVYPVDELYKEDFKEVTALRFPDHAEILSKSASYPDIHGDYTSAAAVQLSSKEFITLSDKIKYSDFTEQSFTHHPKELKQVQNDIHFIAYKKHYVKELNDKVLMIGFMNDNTIIFCRTSW